MLALVIGVACVGKLVGCTLGAMWGGLRFWEAASIAVAMNARGAMEIVVAMIGLSLGILNAQMFSIIVMVAIVTSFMAPIGLRLTMPRVRMTEEEARRILASASKGAFDPQRLRVLLATGGGPNALAAAPLAFGIGARSDSPLAVVYAEVKTGWWRRTWDRLRRATPTNVSQHIETLKSPASNPSTPGRPRSVASRRRTVARRSATRRAAATT